MTAPTAPADAGTPPDPMRDVLGKHGLRLVSQLEMVDRGTQRWVIPDYVRAMLSLIRNLAARLAAAEHERDRLREEVREFELNENCRAKG